MDEYKIIDPFKPQNVEILELPEKEDSRYGTDLFNNVKELAIGKGSKVFRGNQSGIWLGAETFADAPFSVDMEGNVIASSISISGYIPTGGALGDIGAGNITSTYIGSGAITTPKIATNAITADKIQAGSITTDKLVAGEIIGFTITGALIRTSSSGIRTVLDGSDSRIKFMNGATVFGYIEPTAGTNTTLVIDVQGYGISINDNVSNPLFRYVSLDAPYVQLNGVVSSPQNIGSVNSGGGGSLPSGWSASNIATGRYEVTHNLGTTAYSVVVSPVVSIAKIWSIESKGSNSFIVRIANTSFSLENNPFDFILLKR